jgi:hypothetical protein
VIFAGGSTPTVTAPSTNPRIDVLTIDSSGVLAWTTGAENASPVAPTYPANKAALIELKNVVGETALYDNDNQQTGQGFILNDVRTFLQYAFNPTSLTTGLLPDGDGTRDLGSASFEWNNIYAKSGFFLNGSPINSQLTTPLTAGGTVNAGDALCVLPAPAVGSQVTYDNGVSASAAGTSASFSFTVANNSNRMLIVIAAINSANSINSATYNGVSMSVGASANSGNVKVKVFYLAAPATGANTVVITPSASDTVFYSVYSYYNVNQVAPTSTPITGSGETSLNISYTTTINASLVLAGGLFEGFSPTNPTIGTAHQTNGGTNSSNAGDAGIGAPFKTISGLIVASSGAGTAFHAAGIIEMGPANATNNFVYQASSALAGDESNFIGFAQGASTIGNSVTVTLGGVVTGLSGLTTGSQYYLNDTAGTIGASPGTITRKVGIALSATTLLVTNVW